MLTDSVTLMALQSCRQQGKFKILTCPINMKADWLRMVSLNLDKPMRLHKERSRNVNMVLWAECVLLFLRESGKTIQRPSITSNGLRQDRIQKDTLHKIVSE